MKLFNDGFQGKYLILRSGLTFDLISVWGISIKNDTSVGLAAFKRVVVSGT